MLETIEVSVLLTRTRLHDIVVLRSVLYLFTVWYSSTFSQVLIEPRRDRLSMGRKDFAAAGKKAGTFGFS